MGFRSVEPEPDEETSEATPAVPGRWIALGVGAFAMLSVLPIAGALTLGVLSAVLDDHPHHHERVVERIVRDVDQSELEPKTRVYPEYPDAATLLDLPPQRCLAVVSMDEGGVPYNVDVDGCPDVFIQPTQDAMLQWRWYPPTHDGNPTAARTTIAVTYKVDHIAPSVVPPAPPEVVDRLSAQGEVSSSAD